MKFLFTSLTGTQLDITKRMLGYLFLGELLPAGECLCVVTWTHINGHFDQCRDSFGLCVGQRWRTIRLRT